MPKKKDNRGFTLYIEKKLNRIEFIIFFFHFLKASLDVDRPVAADTDYVIKLVSITALVIFYLTGF